MGVDYIVTRVGKYAPTAALFLCSFALMLVFAKPLHAQETAGDAALFFPALPELPRIQYLAKFSAPLDVGGESGGFRDFLFGGEDAEAHLVAKPYGVALFEGAIYVVDTRGGGYGVFDVANGITRFVRPSGAGRLSKPINITIDSDGTRYVTDTDREQIVVFDRNDRFVRAFGEAEQYTPVDVVVSGDSLYVTDIFHHQVHEIEKRTGEILNTFGEAGSLAGQLYHPTNLALGPDNHLYVTDTTNFRIQVFTLEGELVGRLGAVGTTPGQFARPKGVAVSRDNHVYAVDAAFQNVQILEPDGRPLLFFGGVGNGPGTMNLPTVVKLDYENVEHFQQYAHPDFEIEYLILVVNQFGPNKVLVFGFGAMRD